MLYPFPRKKNGKGQRNNYTSQRVIVVTIKGRYIFFSFLLTLCISFHSLPSSTSSWAMQIETCAMKLLPLDWRVMIIRLGVQLRAMGERENIWVLQWGIQLLSKQSCQDRRFNYRCRKLIMNKERRNRMKMVKCHEFYMQFYELYKC